MTHPSSLLTPTNLIAATANILEGGGYQSIRKGFPEWSTISTRLFEDAYNVVGVAVFTTCSDLLLSWADLQGSLVDVISRQVGRTENKAWDGYLVLLTAGIAPSGDLDIEAIRRDTKWLRKLVATGEDLNDASDVERLLRPLLPLRTEQGSISQDSALDLLPDLLAESGIGRDTTRVIVKSFIEQKPLMEALHRSRGSQ